MRQLYPKNIIPRDVENADTKAPNAVTMGKNSSKIRADSLSISKPANGATMQQNTSNQTVIKTIE